MERIRRPALSEIIEGLSDQKEHQKLAGVKRRVWNIPYFPWGKFYFEEPKPGSRFLVAHATSEANTFQRDNGFLEEPFP